ncbi:MAG TPA: cytochrome c [Chloroflexi bacterium]|nr:cytochrome c [Chloroflexota bacterium]
MFKRVVLFTLVILSLTLLAACGGDEKKEEAPPPQQQEQPTAAPQAAAPAAIVGDAANGGKIFSTACVACHGPEGKGVQGLGKDLTTSEWVAQQTDEQLIEFIKKGRDAGDPLNTTGVAMPPKGGNPAMSDQEVADIVAFVRSIHQQP